MTLKVWFLVVGFVYSIVHCFGPSAENRGRGKGEEGIEIIDIMILQ